MRRSLGILALLIVLAGCGDSDGTPASYPGTSTSPAGTVTQVALLTGTGAGGEVTTEPTVLPDQAAVEAYAAQFRNDTLQQQIVSTAQGTDVPAGQQLAAAVVAVGCEVPTEVTGTVSGDDVTLQATVPSTTKECFAPMTSVAIMLVPA